MTPANENGHKDPWWVWPVVGAMILSIPAGIILAWYYDNPYYLIMTAVGVILGLAG